jgi:hypothetical protein
MGRIENTMAEYTKLESDLIHAQNDLFQFRCKINGKLKFDIDLLRDALSALRREKSHVTIDHVERVIMHMQQIQAMCEDNG